MEKRVYSGTSPLGHLSKGGTLVMGTLFIRPIYIISIYFNLSNGGTLLMGTKSSSPGGVPISEVPLYNANLCPGINVNIYLKVIAPFRLLPVWGISWNLKNIYFFKENNSFRMYFWCSFLFYVIHYAFFICTKRP